MNGINQWGFLFRMNRLLAQIVSLQWLCWLIDIISYKSSFCLRRAWLRRQMREFEAPNQLLYLFEAGINLALINADIHIREDFLARRNNASRFEMMQTNIEAIDCPYRTTNTPSFTIHHTLIVCEAVRRVCPWDDERDAEENDWSDAYQTNVARNIYEMRRS